MIDTFVSHFTSCLAKRRSSNGCIRQLLARISARPGCATIRVHRSVTNPLEYMVHGTWLTKEAWERAHQTTPEFKSLFNSLPIEHHSLSRASFFEPAYECAGASIEP
jgi:Uncharacterized conserved protein